MLAALAPVLRGLVAALAASLLTLSPAQATPPPSQTRVKPLPVNADWDYQIGGVRRLPDGITVVSRDRTAAPVPRSAVYNICYVNGFQTQESEAGFWRVAARRDLVLRRPDGSAVGDPAWHEWLLDTRTVAKRARLARIVGRWIDGCARQGFDAVEIDNLDSWSRSERLLRRRDNLSFARRLIARAHQAGLAIGQKNTVELGRLGPQLGFDFVVAESCAEWDECGRYRRAYRDRMLAVEYSQASFVKACRAVGDRVAVVWRDRDVSSTGPSRTC